MLRLPVWTGRLAVLFSLLNYGCDTVKSSKDGAAPTASANSSREQRALAVGHTFETPTIRVKLVSQGDCGSSSQDAIQNGYRRWAAELEITNLSSASLPVSAFHATLRDDGNFTYTTSLSDCTNILVARLLREGATVRGFVPFQIPQSIQNAVLSYRFTAPDKTEAVARFHIEF